MNVMLVAQCNKRALIESRRIIDQFAERKGSRTWQTAITQQGLFTLRKMLRKTARRNSAVACHWIKSGGTTELLWIVGNIHRFNEQGTVPTNITGRDVLRSKNENQWNAVEDIALLAGIAGLFHDFGKANTLFQKKLQGKRKSSEPYRHEWLSLRLFQSFVGDLSDQAWLEKLLVIGKENEQPMYDLLVRDGLGQPNNPFRKEALPPLGQIVAWLIVSHHRLPRWPGKRGDDGMPEVGRIEKWLSQKFETSWNSPQCWQVVPDKKEIKGAWTFLPQGLPVRSSTWQAKATSLARRALQRVDLCSGKKEWMVDAFSMHVSRLSLMLADHSYSANEPFLKWQDKKYKPYANTYRETRDLKQKLDEHIVGVSHNAYLLAKGLPTLRLTLPSIARHKGFKKRSPNTKFHWQDKAYEIACGIRSRAADQGFFGVNMASTGCGKTFANGRIMYGLANEKLGCRFSVALGLRTLTLQTGDALRERLHLQDDDLAVLIGSQAVKQLHRLNHEREQEGSESTEEMFEPGQYVRYEGALDDGRLSKWLKQDSRLHQLVSAPILVSTIDHLILATEGERGGKQIAPMLRLLTSDLVLDEPDDFALEDVHALCRLVNWSGMLGARVLLSSATLPPSLIEALFLAYLEGRREYQKSSGEPGRALNVCCAWFDENKAVQSDHTNPESFMEAHTKFVLKRVEKLATAQPLRKAELLPVPMTGSSVTEVMEAVAGVIHASLHCQHAAHYQHQPKTAKRISVGLIRMANINPLVAVGKKLMAMEPLPGHHVHYCFYHGQHPLVVRSEIERQLDVVLTRHEADHIWQRTEIKTCLREHPEDNHIFVVLATSVAEVGRDHDYDWAIAEPSSMRSIIQLAGRIQRHRKLVPKTPNLLILSQNYKALTGSEIAFFRPGFESEQAKLHSHNLSELLTQDQYQIINSIPRIAERKPLEPKKNLVDLEHAQQAAYLFGSDERVGDVYSALWWESNCHWCSELQRISPFRKSQPDMEYVLYFEEEGDTPKFQKVDNMGDLKQCDKEFQRIECSVSSRVSFWGTVDPATEITRLAEVLDLELKDACRKFGVMRLLEKRWLYHPALGIHGELD